MCGHLVPFPSATPEANQRSMVDPRPCYPIDAWSMYWIALSFGAGLNIGSRTLQVLQCLEGRRIGLVGGPSPLGFGMDHILVHFV